MVLLLLKRTCSFNLILSFETVTVEDTSAEEARLDAALKASQDELSIIREKAVETLGEEAAAVFDAHLMVLC